MAALPAPPKLCARYLREFSSRQSIINMLSMNKAPPSPKSQESQKAEPKSSPDPPLPKKRRNESSSGRGQTLLSSFVTPNPAARQSINFTADMDPADEALIESILREDQMNKNPLSWTNLSGTGYSLNLTLLSVINTLNLVLNSSQRNQVPTTGVTFGSAQGNSHTF